MSVDDPGHERWRERYRSNATPWDLGGPHPELAHRISTGELRAPRRGARAYVPGCGRGHDAVALSSAGWTVVAVDVVAGLTDVVGNRLESHGGSFVAEDALRFVADEPFDLIWEHTFYCAIPPHRRTEYGSMVRRLTSRGGRLAAVVFPVNKPEDAGGPPWRSRTEDIERTLGASFSLLRDEPMARPVGRRSWGERYALFERTEA